MTDAVDFAAGGYRFLPSVFQYSGGAAALPGHAIERVRFRSPLPLAEGFARIERIIGAAGRPLPRSAPANCARPRRSPSRAFAPSTRSTSSRWRNGACSTAR